MMISILLFVHFFECNNIRDLQPLYKCVILTYTSTVFLSTENGLRQDKKRQNWVEDSQKTQKSLCRPFSTHGVPQEYMPWHLCHLHSAPLHSHHAYAISVTSYPWIPASPVYHTCILPVLQRNQPVDLSNSPLISLLYSQPFVRLAGTMANARRMTYL